MHQRSDRQHHKSSKETTICYQCKIINCFPCILIYHVIRLRIDVILSTRFYAKTIIDMLFREFIVILCNEYSVTSIYIQLCVCIDACLEVVSYKY